VRSIIDEEGKNPFYIKGMMRGGKREPGKIFMGKLITRSGSI